MIPGNNNDGSNCVYGRYHWSEQVDLPHLQCTTFASCSFTDALDISGTVYPAGLNATYNSGNIIFAPVKVTRGVEKLSGLSNVTCMPTSTTTRTSTSKSRNVAATNDAPLVAGMVLSGVAMLVTEVLV
jgi:hypothetical protein